MATGAVWMIGMRLSIAVLGFASTLILARLLVPADFGLIVLGTSMLAAFDMLISFRFDIALIQKQDTTREDYDTAWTLNQILGAALAVMLCLAAVPASVFFEEPRLAPIIMVLGATALFDGLQNIGVVQFRKNLDYRRDFLFLLSRKLMQVVVAASMALWLRNYWALVAGIVAASVTGLVASNVMQPFRPRWCLTRWRQLMVFSKWMLLDSVIYFLRHRAPDVLIGKIAGPASLGLFGMAHELAMIARNNVASPIDRAMFPGYARMGGETETLRSSYLAVVGMTTLIAMPVAVGAVAVAELVVPLLFGNQWLGSVPVLQVLGLSSATALLSSGSGAIFAALGRPRILVWMGAVYVTVLIAALAVLLPRAGVVGAAWAFLSAAALMLPLKLWVLNSVIGLNPVRWLGRVWRPVAAAAAMLAVVAAVLDATAADAAATGDWLRLLLAMCAGAACYVIIALALWLLAGRPDGPERFLLDRWRDRHKTGGADVPSTQFRARDLHSVPRDRAAAESPGGSAG